MLAPCHTSSQKATAQGRMEFWAGRFIGISSCVSSERLPPHPARLRRVLDNFPGLQVIAAHFGGYSMYETAYDLLHDKDCVFDVSSSMMFMEDGIAEKYINIYGAERMAFGTDYPLWNPVPETKRFLQLKLTDEQFAQIGHKTVDRILNL